MLPATLYSIYLYKLSHESRGNLIRKVNIQYNALHIGYGVLKGYWCYKLHNMLKSTPLKRPMISNFQHFSNKNSDIDADLCK